MRPPVVTEVPPFESVATFRAESGLHFTATHLATLLRAHNPKDLERVDIAKELFYVPKWPGLILRWNESDGQDCPFDFEALMQHMTTVEHEFDRLRQLGMPMLRRTAFVVAKDPYHRQNMASVYTVVQRYGSGTTLNATTANTKLNQRRIQRQGAIRAILNNYWDDTAPGKPYLKDLEINQCATDGTLYDYDPYLDINDE